MFTEIGDMNEAKDSEEEDENGIDAGIVVSFVGYLGGRCLT